MAAKTDLAIVGGGPAALAAALYASREDIKTVIYERDSITGGLISLTAQVDNYPGFAEGVTGPDLGEAMSEQAKRFGAKIKTRAQVERIEPAPSGFKLSGSFGETMARAVLITTGNHYRNLGIPGEDEYRGRGVHYCAVCDGPLYRDKKLVVVGGGDSAMQEGLFLTKFASKIIVLVRGTKLKGTEMLIEQVTQHPKIEIHYQTAAERIEGDQLVRRVVAKNTSTRETQNFDCEGVFVFIGLIPNTDWLKGTLQLDAQGAIIADEQFQTSLPGVFAAGDVRSGSNFQIASAVGEGVSAALVIRQFLDTHI